MTSVVGIMNKRGVAIAADSAVTRGRKKNGRREQKVTKNGNKMVRLCEGIPVAVMITGNADYLHTPWDVIVRRYRQKYGYLEHSTVEAAVHDFFAFIQSDPVFWGTDCGGGFVWWVADKVFDGIISEVGDPHECDSDDVPCPPAAFIQAFRHAAASMQNKWEKGGVCPQFKDYSIDSFRSAAERIISDFLNNIDYPDDVLKEIRPSFEEAVWTALRTRRDDEPSATLVFAGYGKDQVYPSLVSAVVCEGFDRRVNYHIRPDEIVCIGEDRPVAICPFAQDDVIKSVLRGIHMDWSEGASNVFPKIVNPFFSDVFTPSLGEEDPGLEFTDMLAEVETDDLQRQFFKEGLRLLNKNQRMWEKSLKDCDLADLASLADCLIDLTGFHRILTFSQEGVGGPVDVAVISKNEGFTWLRRKSWYHKDGPMGI